MLYERRDTLHAMRICAACVLMRMFVCLGCIMHDQAVWCGASELHMACKLLGSVCCSCYCCTADCVHRSRLPVMLYESTWARKSNDLSLCGPPGTLLVGALADRQQ
jgi:hypothetical protein